MNTNVDDAALRALVRIKKGGRFEECHGPHELCHGLVWDIWVYVPGDEEYDIRFAFLPSGASELEYISSFADLCVVTRNLCRSDVGAKEREIHALQNAVNALEVKLKERSFTLKVAALVFVACVAVMLYMIVTSRNLDARLIGVFIATMASGGAMFFGRWIPISKA